MDLRVYAATTRTRLDRGPHRHDRVSLGGRTKRTRGRAAGGVLPLQGGGQSGGGTPAGRRTATPAANRPVNLAAGGGSGCRYPRPRPRAPGRYVTGLSLQQTDLAA